MTKLSEFDFEAARSLLYCAAKEYARKEKKQFTYTVEDFGDFIDTMPQEDYNDIMNEIMESRFMGKSLRDMSGGATVGTSQ